MIAIEYNQGMFKTNSIGAKDMKVTKTFVRRVFARIKEQHPDLIMPGATGWWHYLDYDNRDHIAANMERWGWAEQRGMLVMTQLGYNEV